MGEEGRAGDPSAGDGGNEFGVFSAVVIACGDGEYADGDGNSATDDADSVGHAKCYAVEGGGDHSIVEEYMACRMRCRKRKRRIVYDTVL